MKFKKFLPFLSALLLTLLVGVFFLPRLLAAPSEDQAFTAFTQEVFCQEISSDTLTLHYALANPAAYEISTGAASFGLYSPENEQTSAAVLENTRKALQAFSRQALSPENQLTYDVLVYQLERELELVSYEFYEEIFSPTLGIQAQLPILLAEYAFRSEQDIQDYLALLEQLDTYYESLLDYQRRKSMAGLFMSDKTADAVITQCQEFIANSEEHFLLRTFEERLAEVDFLTEASRQAYIASNRAVLFGHVFPAYELLIEGLESLKGTGTNSYGLGYYEHGCDYYQALVSCTVGTGRSLEKIIKLIDSQLDADLETIASIVAGRPEILTSVSRPINALEPVHILELLEQKIQQDFPETAPATCEVKYVTPSLENYLSPAFYLTPPLDLMEVHVIYINPAGNHDNLSLFTTLAHEGYPGHLYQTLYENSCHLDPVRNLFYFGGYIEGWATYIEQYVYDYTSLDPDMAKLLAANSFLSLGLHARADAGIHYEGWTPEDTFAFFADYGITNETTIDSIYQAIVQDPGNYLKYYLGAVEIQELKKAAEAALGENFVLKEFHEFLLSMGPAPFPVIETYMEKWIANVKSEP